MNIYTTIKGFTIDQRLYNMFLYVREQRGEKAICIAREKQLRNTSTIKVTA